MRIDWTSPLAGIDPIRAHRDHPVWADIAPRDGKPGFRPSEFSNPYEMDAHFLMWLYQCRLQSLVPFRIIKPNGDARPAGIGATLSAHTEIPCRAVDLQVFNSYERAVVTVACVLNGCRRFGTYPGSNDADKGGLHVDCTTRPQNPSPRWWTKH